MGYIYKWVSAGHLFPDWSCSSDLHDVFSFQYLFSQRTINVFCHHGFQEVQSFIQTETDPAIQPKCGKTFATSLWQNWLWVASGDTVAR